RVTEKFVLRTGYGVSYFPRRMGQTNFPILQNNGYPAPNVFAPASVTMTTGFPAFVPFTIPSNGIIENAPLSNAYTITPRDLASPNVQSWNFAIQRALPHKFSLDVAYVGNKGTNNQSGYDLNASMVTGSGNNGRPLFQAFRKVTGATTALGTSTWYNGLQTKLDRRVGDGIFLTTSYTFSKGLNFTDDDGGLATNMNLMLNKGRMSDNRSHVFTQSYMMHLPFGKGKKWLNGGGAAGFLLGGWQFQGLLSMMTGNWFSPSVSGVNNAPGNADRPNWIAPIRYLGGAGPGQKFFDPASFATPAQNTLGNAGRNIIQGPGIVNLDAALHREFRVSEGKTLTLRVESFNFSNTPHYSNPNGNAQSPQFGEINGAEQDQRQYQIGLTFRF
ncbi:MAG: TonB-dependent receptor, partial [Bryobacterales bacterium]|nr:TonB-dependent receptor [Bryobacterales bacterium]